MEDPGLSPTETTPLNIDIVLVELHALLTGLFYQFNRSFHPIEGSCLVSKNLALSWDIHG